MPPPAHARVLTRALVAALAALGGGLTFAGPARAADPVDAVLDRTSTQTVPVPRATEHAQRRLRRQLGARALVQPDPTTGTPRIVARLDGFLTSPSPRNPEAIALDYVRAHADAFGLDADDIAGLRLTARASSSDGTVHLTWEQRSGGLPSIDGGLHAAVTKEGRLLNVRGGAIPDPGGAPAEPGVSAASAYATALPGSAAAPAATDSGDAAHTTSFAGGGRASLVRYRDDGANRVGWRVLVPAGSSAFYDAIVDARTGRLQRRINRVRFASQVRHFDVNPRAPGASSQLTPSIPDRWLADQSIGLEGPYVHAVSDLDDTIQLVENNGSFGLSQQPTTEDEVVPTSVSGSDRTWNYAPKLGSAYGFCAASCSWSTSNVVGNREFSTGQLFWYVNTFRDHLAAEPIGFVGPGEFNGDDAVLAQALDGASTGPDSAHTSNASMLVLPDGFPGLMQMHLFGPPVMGRYDGAMDASIVYHEYTHGLSERLVKDSQGFGTLGGPQPGAIAEGTSDFYAMDYLTDVEPIGVPDDPATQGEVRVGRWLQSNPAATGVTAVRTEGLDCAVEPVDATQCPGTPSAGAGGYDYADFGRITSAPEAHDDGEIWGQTLWSLRAALAAEYGTGEGLDRVRAYVTEGLRLAPDYPTFLDMRNAIVQAAVSLHGNADWQTIWQVFADRGMGWSAATDGPTDLTPFVADDVPPPPGPTGRGLANGIITDEAGAPVGGASVAVAGHDSGLGVTDLATTTGGDGRYALPPAPEGDYPDLYVRKAGFQELTTALNVQAGATTTTNFTPLRRDYASAFSGGSVSSFTGPNFGGFGCGPSQAIDDDKSTVWSTAANAGPRDLVVDLGRSIDLREVRIDPRAGCGDGPEASLAQYELAASDGPSQPFETIAGGAVGTADARGYVALPLTGDLGGRRLLRLRAIAPRSLDQGGSGPFMDVSELEVTGTPVPVVTPPQTPAPSPPPTPPPVATTTALKGKRLTATRKGLFKVKVRFGDAAPLGNARISVFRKRKRIARAGTPVQPGRTVTKTLRLTRKGLRAIRPGRTKKVKLQLRLPGGGKLSKTMKLTRKR